MNQRPTVGWPAPQSGLAPAPLAGDALFAASDWRAGRALLLALCLLVVLVLGWAWWARLDIVVLAPGRVVVAGHNPLVQATEPATVGAVHVTEGQHVTAGQLLLELDNVALTAELTRLATEARTLAHEQALRRANLACLRSQDCLEPVVGEPVPGGQAAAQWQSYRTTLAALGREVTQKRVLLAATRTRLASLTRTLGLLAEESAALAALQARGVVPRVQWAARERERLAALDTLDAMRGSLRAGEAELTVLAARREATTAAFVERTLTEQAEVAARQRALGSELAHVALRLAATRRHAPATGRVHALAVRTAGTVVGAGSALLEIVPDAAPRTVEAAVANRDIGAVRPGQAVVIKVDAYDFSRYGTLAGTVTRIAADAVEGEDHQWRFGVGIALDPPAPGRDARPVPLAAGMTVSVEFALGQRRALDYLLAPLRRYRAEAAREP